MSKLSRAPSLRDLSEVNLPTSATAAKQSSSFGSKYTQSYFEKGSTSLTSSITHITSSAPSRMEGRSKADSAAPHHIRLPHEIMPPSKIFSLERNSSATTLSPIKEARPSLETADEATHLPSAFPVSEMPSSSLHATISSSIVQGQADAIPAPADYTRKAYSSSIAHQSNYYPTSPVGGAGDMPQPPSHYREGITREEDTSSSMTADSNESYTYLETIAENWYQHYITGRTYKLHGDYNSALRFLLAAEKNAPYEYSSELCVLIADTYLILENFKSVIEYGKKGLEYLHYSNTANKNELKAVLFGNIAEGYHKQTNLEKAEKYYKKAELINPDDILPLAGLGSIYKYKSEWLKNQSLECFNRVYEICITYPDTTNGLNPKEREWIGDILQEKISSLKGKFNEVKDLIISLNKSGLSVSLPEDIEEALIEAGKESSSFVKGDLVDINCLMGKLKHFELDLRNQKAYFEENRAVQAARDASQDEAIANLAKVYKEAFESLSEACSELARTRPTRDELSTALADEADISIYREKIEPSAKLLAYYNAFLTTFNQTFNACFIQGSGRFDIKGTSVDLKPVIDLIPVPIVKEIVGFSVFGVNKILQIREHNKVMNIAKLSNSISEMEKIAAKLALQLAILKEDAIQSAIEETSSPWYKKLASVIKKAKDVVYEDPYKTPQEKLGAADSARLIADCLKGEFDGSKGAVRLLQQFKDYYLKAEAETENKLASYIEAGLEILPNLVRGAGKAAEMLGADGAVGIADYIASGIESIAAAATEIGAIDGITSGVNARSTSAGAGISIYSNNIASQNAAPGIKVNSSTNPTISSSTEVDTTGTITFNHNGQIITVTKEQLAKLVVGSSAFSTLPTDAGAGALISDTNSPLVPTVEERSASATINIDIQAKKPLIINPGKHCCTIMMATVIYDNEILNHPELLWKAYNANPNLYQTLIDLSAEGFSVSELSGVVDIYSLEELV